MTAVPQSQGFARLITREPKAFVQGLLTVVGEQLAMSVAFVSVLNREQV